MSTALPSLLRSARIIPLSTLAPPRGVPAVIFARRCVSSLTSLPPSLLSPLSNRRLPQSPLSRFALLQPSRSSSSSSGPLAPGTSRDPSHPNLYYHTLHLDPDNPTDSRAVLALSFLPHPPSRADSPAVIGYLPAVEGAGLNDFRPNPGFLPALHTAIRASLSSPSAPPSSLTVLASTRPTDGFIHLIDGRNPPPPGRVGDPDDLIASVFVRDGQVDVSSYEEVTSYRVVSGEGVCTLPEGIREWVENWLKEKDQEWAKKK